MKHVNRVISLLLLLSITAGSTAALAAENMSTVKDSSAITVYDDDSDNEVPEVENTHPKITAIKNRANYVEIQSDFADNFSGLSESFTVYCSTNNSPMIEKTNGIRGYIDLDRSFAYDYAVKNGNFYRYKLATVVWWSSDSNREEVARSNAMATYYLSSVNNITIKNSSSGKTMKISWPRNTKADGYRIRYQYQTRNGKFGKLIRKKIKGNKTTSLTLKNRTPGKQYLVDIRSSKTYKGKTYFSKWSNKAQRYE